MQAINVTLHEVFTSAHNYQVAPYQRHYEWTEHTAKKLMIDLLDNYDIYQKNKKHNYFIGAFIFHKKGSTLSEIVDGQQRLASFTILFAVLRDLIETQAEKDIIHHYIYNQYRGNEEDRPPRIQLIRDDDAFFRNEILPEGKTNQLDQVETADADYLRIESRQCFHNNAILFRDMLAIAFNIFEKSDDIKYSKSDLPGFFKFITQYCHAIAITAESEEEAYRVFQTINSTGQPLEFSDLLRIELVYKLTNDTSERTNLFHSWTDIERHIGGQKQMPKLINSVWALFFQDMPWNEFKQREAMGELSQDQAKAFFSLLERYKPLYRQILIEQSIKEISNIKHRDAINYRIRSLNLIAPYVIEWLPIAFILIDRYKSSPATLARYLKGLDQISWYFYLRSTDKFIETERKNYFVEVIKRMKKYPANEFRGLSLSDDKKTVMKNLLEEFDPKDIVLNVLLRRIEYAYLPLTQKNKTKSLLKALEGETAEHVLPRSPVGKNLEGWLAAFNGDQNFMTVQMRKIGNLCLLPENLNNALGNHLFDEKNRQVQDYIKSKGNLKSNLARHVFNKSWTFKQQKVWNSANIKKRTTDIIKILSKDFGL